MSNYVNILKQADIFYKLTPTHLEMISSICRERTYRTNDLVFLEGSKSNELYVIAKGEVDIQVDPSLVTNQKDGHFTPTTIATLRRGQSFGEVALVDHGLRSATARIKQDQTTLLILPRDELNQLCESQPDLGYRLMKNLAADLAFKLRATDLHLRENFLSRET